MKRYKTEFLVKASVAQADQIEIDYAKSKANAEVVDPEKDLMKMTSVLVSTGINKNDDVFIAEEVLPARNSGANKPVNIEHDETKIIGNMVRTFVTDKDGNEIDSAEIDEDSSVVPDEFDITNEAVIYSFLFPEIAEEIKASAEEGNLFVSIEAWFTSFDYLLGTRVIERNTDTASVLDQHLRSNGGEGFFRGEKLGRVLRNLLIGGVGVVAEPANPESVIRSVASIKAKNVNIDDTVLSENIIGEICKASLNEEGDDEMSQKRIDELEAIVKAQGSLLDELQKEKLQKVRCSALVELGMSEEIVAEETDRVLAFTEEEFEAYKAFCVKLLNSKGGDAATALEEATEAAEEALDSAQASAETDSEEDEADKTEAGDAEKAEDEEADTAEAAEEEDEEKEDKADAEKEPKADASAESTEEEVTQDQDEQAVANVDLDNIDPVDPSLDSEGSAEESLADRMGAAMMPFLAKHNSRWGDIVKKEAE